MTFAPPPTPDLVLYHPSQTLPLDLTLRRETPRGMAPRVLGAALEALGHIAAHRAIMAEQLGAEPIVVVAEAGSRSGRNVITNRLTAQGLRPTAVYDVLTALVGVMVFVIDPTNTQDLEVTFPGLVQGIMQQVATIAGKGSPGGPVVIFAVNEHLQVFVLREQAPPEPPAAPAPVPAAPIAERAAAAEDRADILTRIAAAAAAAAEAAKSPES